MLMSGRGHTGGNLPKQIQKEGQRKKRNVLNRQLLKRQASDTTLHPVSFQNFKISSRDGSSPLKRLEIASVCMHWHALVTGSHLR